MASRIATGAITLLDVADGNNPLAITLGNQSHIFAADTFGKISVSERNVFRSEVFAFVGSTRATYDATAVPANNTYKITGISETAGWQAVNTPTNVGTGGNQAVITCNGTPENTSNRTGTVDLSIDVKNSVGNVTSVVLTITWSVMIEGAGGSAVWLTPSRLTFQFDETGTDTTDGSITIDVATAGNLGGLEAKYLLNGTSNWDTAPELIQGGAANKASAIDINGIGDNDKIVITAANFGTADIFSIRVKGDAGGSDTISIIKIKNGKTGRSSLFVSITSNKDGFAFKNNNGEGTAKTLTAKVFDMVDGAEITTASRLAYRWQKNGVNFGGTAKTQVVTAADVNDNGSDQFQCNVTVTD